MDPELKTLLEKNLTVAEDTNRILRSMQRQAWWGFAGKIVLFLLLFVLPLLFLPMVISKFMSTLQSDGTSGSFDVEGLQKLLEQYKVE